MIGVLIPFRGLFSQNPVHLNYTVENGLPSNCVYYSLQDSDGFLWFATDQGIVRYDGIKFKTFTTRDGLSDNECYDIFEDSQKRIWFATFNGEPCYYFQGNFHNPSNTAFLKKIKPGGYGLKFLEDAEQNVYYASSYMLYRIGKNNEVIFYDIGESQVINLVRNDQKQVFLYANLEGIYRLYKIEGTEVIELMIGEQGLLPYVKPQFAKKNFWIQDKDLLIRYQPGKKVQKIPIPVAQSTIQYFQLFDHLWVGTNKGLYIQNEQGGFQHFLKDCSIGSIKKDREGNIWLTSLNRGIFLIVNAQASFYDLDSDLKFNNCLTINPLQNNTLAIGSSDSKYCFVRGGQLYSNKATRTTGNGNILRIADFRGAYLTGSGSTLCTIDQKFQSTPSKQSIFNIKDFLLCDDAKVIVISGNAILRFATDKLLNGLAVRDDAEVLSNVKSSRLHQTQDGKIYASGPFGLLRLDGNQFQWIDKDNPLMKNIQDVYLDQQGILWITSSVNGLLAYYQEKIYHLMYRGTSPFPQLTSVSAGSGLNNLWIGSNEGLYQVRYHLKGDKIQLSSTNFNQSHGLISKQVNDVFFRNDSLWIACSKGLCIIREQDLTPQKNKPLLILNNLESSLKNYSIDHPIELAPDENSLKISFNGISFSSLGKVSYRYRFLNRDKNWQSSDQNQLEFASLSAGDYQLQIKCVDAFGNESKIHAVSFKIRPVFYKTWWFISITLLGALIMIGFIVVYRLQKIKDKHKIQERILHLENEKLRIEHKEITLNKELVELEQKALRLQMNPHFIFNSINTIQALYKRDQNTANEYLVKFSTLLRQILDFSQLKKISLQQEIEFTVNYLEINKLRFEKQFDYHINYSEDLNPTITGISPMVTQPFIENALIHGIQGLKDRNGQINVSFFKEDAYVICEIEDNGIGREQSGKNNKYRGHQSHGLDISQKRLRIFNQEGDENSIVIEDLYHENGSPLGTKVIIRFLYETIEF